MPWGRCDDSFYDHPKLDLLPADRRLEAVGLYWRSISWCNRFLTDGHIPRARVERLDGSLDLADLLVAAGLFDPSANGYQVHDFLEFNDSRVQVEERRKKESDRKAAWRAGKRPGGTDSGTSSVDDDVVPRVVPASVPPSVPAGHDEMSRAESQRDSGARARNARHSARHDANPGPTRPDPSHESLERDSPRGRAHRADVQALYDRGWKRVTKAQRRVLDEILERHDVTGAEFAAAAIRSAPPDADPLEAAMTADALWQASRRRQADADEAAWQQTRDEERVAASAVPWLDAVKVEVEA